MKTNEEYLKDYDEKLNNLIEKGEEWRIRVTRQEYLSEIERLRIYEKEEMIKKRFNNFHIQSNINGTISIMLMNRVTHEEAVEQAERLEKSKQKRLKEQIPVVLERLKLIKTPLSFQDAIYIYKCLFYKQITLDNIPENVLKEFKKTSLYQKIVSIENE